MSKVIDLDILRPEPRIVKIDGKEIDVSFIPCGITFDLDAIISQLIGLNQEKVLADPVAMRNAFDLSIKLCAIFCNHKYPYMDEEWFKNNVNPAQINGFTTAIQAALVDSYSGVKAHSKN